MKSCSLRHFDRAGCDSKSIKIVFPRQSFREYILHERGARKLRRAIIMARNYANHEETIARDALIRRHRCQSRRLLRGVRIPADRCKHRCKLRQRRGGGCRRSGGDGCQKRMLKSCRARNLPQDVADYLATNRPPEIGQKNDADCQKERLRRRDWAHEKLKRCQRHGRSRARAWHRFGFLMERDRGQTGREKITEQPADPLSASHRPEDPASVVPCERRPGCSRR